MSPLLEAIRRSVPLRLSKNFDSRDIESCISDNSRFLGGRRSTSILVSEFMLSGEERAGESTLPSSSPRLGDKDGIPPCGIFPPSIPLFICDACSCKRQCILNQFDRRPYLIKEKHNF